MFNPTGRVGIYSKLSTHNEHNSHWALWEKGRENGIIILLLTLDVSRGDKQYIESPGSGQLGWQCTRKQIKKLTPYVNGSSVLLKGQAVKESRLNPASFCSS